MALNSSSKKQPNDTKNRFRQFICVKAVFLYQNPMNIFSVVEKNSNHFSAFLSIWKSLQSQECKNKEFEATRRSFKWCIVEGWVYGVAV